MRTCSSLSPGTIFLTLDEICLTSESMYDAVIGCPESYHTAQVNALACGDTETSVPERSYNGPIAKAGLVQSQPWRHLP